MMIGDVAEIVKPAILKKRVVALATTLLKRLE